MDNTKLYTAILRRTSSVFSDYTHNHSFNMVTVKYTEHLQLSKEKIKRGQEKE